jgi:hypothetical protein
MIRNKIIGFFLIIFTGNVLLAQDTIVIEQNSTQLFLGKDCSVDLDRSEHFLATKYKDINFALSPDKMHSIRCYLKNESNIDREFLLFFHNAQLDTARYTLKGDDESVFYSPMTSCNRPASERPTLDRTLSIPIVLRKQIVYELIMEVYGREFEIAITPHLVDPSKGIGFRWTDLLYRSLFIYSIIVMAIMFLLLILGKHYKVHTWNIVVFLIYGTSGLFYLLATSGYGSLYIWGAYPWFEVNSPIFFGCISSCALLALSRKVYAFDIKYKFLNKAFQAVSILYVTFALLGFRHYYLLWYAGFYKTLISIPYFCAALCLIAVLYISYITYKQSKSKEHFLLFLFYSCHFVFFGLIVMIENNILTYDFRLHSIVNFVCYIPQIFISLLFLMYNLFNAITKNEQKFESVKRGVLTQLHDTIGDKLAKISLSTHLIYEDKSLDLSSREALKDIGIKAEKSKKMLSILITDLNQEPQKISALQDEIRQVIDSFMLQKSINVKLYLPPPENNIYLDGHTVKQLIRIVKEALNNVIKHAHASEVYIELEEKSSILMLTIKDDGVGYNTDELTTLGHGLGSMKSRVKKIGGRYEVLSKKGEGTGIKLFLELN